MTAGRTTLAVVLAGVILSRLPLLPDGYGSDPDAWRVAATAAHLWETGEYRVSRFPGYPLHELLSAPLVAAGGDVLSNSATLGAMLALLLLWHRLTAGRTRHPLLLLAALAFVPLFWKNSVSTMDYVWSVLCMVGAWHAALGGRPVSAGILLGLTAGFRPPNAVAVLPVVLALLLTVPTRGAAVRFFLSAALTSTAAMLPPLLTYGPAEWLTLTLGAAGEFTFDAGERTLLFGYRAVYAFGPLAVLLAAAAAARGRSELGRAIGARDPLLLSAAAGVVAFAGLYAAWPLEREYLMPMFPFLFILVDRASDRGLMTAFVLALVSFAFLNPDVIRHSGIRGTPEFNIRAGMLGDELELRRLQSLRRAELAALDLPGPAVVMTGSGPEVWIENEAFEAEPDSFWRFSPEVVVRQARNPELRFIDGLTREQISRVRARGYAVYCYDRSREFLEAILGYTMAAEGITVAGAARP